MSPASASSETVMLWGAPASGKSGFVGSLYALYIQRDSGASRWTAHPKDARVNTNTALEMERAYRDLLNEGHYRKTDVRSPEPLDLIIRKRAGEREVDAVRLHLVDPAGEIITEQRHRESSIGLSVHKQAAQSRGLIWLINVGDSSRGAAQAQIEILPELVELLEASGGQQITIPVAICLSMIDKLAGDTLDAAIADPRAMLRRQIGDSLPRWFEAICPNHKYFAISSTGSRKGEVDPINVSTVLDWIVQQGRLIKRPVSSAIVVASHPAHNLPATHSANVNAQARSARQVPSFPVALVRSLALAGALGVTGWAGVAGVRTLISRLRSPQTQTATPSSNSRGNTNTRPTTRHSMSAPRVAANPPTRVVRELLTNSSSEGVLVSTKTERAEETRRRATRTIDSAAAGARSVVPNRYERAHACVTAALRCDSRQVIQDFTWVRAYGTLRQRNEAKKKLDSIFRSSALGAP